MASYIHLLIISIFLFHLFSSSCASDPNLQPYIVYMGGSNGEDDIKVAESAHLHFLSSVISRENGRRFKLGHIFHHAFRGFSAMLTDEEASFITGHEEVVSVFRDRKLKLHTTRSWDFLAKEEGISSFQQYYDYYQPSSTQDDIIIGVLDTGILPESPSFSDKGIAEIPQRWKGACMIGSDSNQNFCNRKLIGARYYDDGTNETTSPRDEIGHGTHTMSTAAGSKVAKASYFGLAEGIARGGSTTSRIASYKVCSKSGCESSAMLKAIDDALKDGVDMISISIGISIDTGSDQLDFQYDPIAIGSFHAQKKGVLVVCSGGNDGPKPYTLSNTAPWLFTVAASNIDRDFESTIVLGNGLNFKGPAIIISEMNKSRKYPLAYAGNLAASSTTKLNASNCMKGSLDKKKAAGKIIVCMDTESKIIKKTKKMEVEEAGGIGIVFCVKTISKGEPAISSGTFPFVIVKQSDGQQILKYINSSKNPTATILGSITVPRIKPAPLVADFSSRGPGSITENILKPDIMAPGVSILAAVVPENGTGKFPKGQEPSKYGLRSGTSMACPHVTGVAALIKSVHRDWTPSMLRSALMTTAMTTNNMGQNFKNGTDEYASPHETGAGEISPFKAINPGLVFPTTTEDYRYFLCYLGYSTKIIQAMTSKAGFKCPKGSSKTLISNLNYPTISIAELKRSQKRTIRRKVMNVGHSNSVYSAKVEAPRGLRVTISPKKMVFTEGLTKATFNVTFAAEIEIGVNQKGYKFGSLTWSDGQHDVRVVFAVHLV